MTNVLFILIALTPIPVKTGPASPDDRVADQVVLRDGSVVLCQVLPNHSDRVHMIVRRAWVEKRLPERAAAWLHQDRLSRQRALVDRAQRLRQWRQERQGLGEPADAIGSWIDAELAHLDRREAGEPFPLMVVSIPRREVSRIDEQPEHRRRMLRQGWRAGFDRVEMMSETQLQAGLQDRGFAPGAIDPAPIDDLLPVPAESNRRWLARRASTEALTDPDLRFSRFGDLVLPDSGDAGTVDQAQMANAVGNLIGSLLGNTPGTDPMKAHLDRIEASGRIGVVVTMLETSPEFDRVAVETALLIRTAPGRWETGTRRRAEVRTADLPANAIQPLAADPQVRAAVQLLNGFGLGQVDPQSQQRGLAVGAATQRALGLARSALEADLNSVALRLNRAPIGPADGAAR